MPKSNRRALSPGRSRSYLRDNAAQIRQRPGFEEVADAVDRLSAMLLRSFTTWRISNKPHRARRQNDRSRPLAPNRRRLARCPPPARLRASPYRGKMTAPQIAMLEKQYLERQLLSRPVCRGSASSISGSCGLPAPHSVVRRSTPPPSEFCRMKFHAANGFSPRR